MIVRAFCECDTFTCLVCNLITGIAPQCCDKCKPTEGSVEVNGTDAIGDNINLKFYPENLTLTIEADKTTVERHMPVIKKLLHYPELVAFS